MPDKQDVQHKLDDTMRCDVTRRDAISFRLNGKSKNA